MTIGPAGHNQKRNFSVDKIRTNCQKTSQVVQPKSSYFGLDP